MNIELKKKLAVEMANYCLQGKPEWENASPSERKEKYDHCFQQMFDWIGDYELSPEAAAHLQRMPLQPIVDGDYLL